MYCLQQSKMVVRHTFSADGISQNKPSEEVITVDLTNNVTLVDKKPLTEMSSADAAHAVNTDIRFPLLLFQFMFLDLYRQAVITELMLTLFVLNRVRYW